MVVRKQEPKEIDRARPATLGQCGIIYLATQKAFQERGRRIVQNKEPHRFFRTPVLRETPGLGAAAAAKFIIAAEKLLI
jgi:hypothetical protein